MAHNPAQRENIGDLADLHQLIDEIKTAMLTTIERDGSLVSRPMTTQCRRDGIDLWFVTTTDTRTVEALKREPEVNVMYYKEDTREWVSASGVATLTQDRASIEGLYKKEWKTWLGDEGGERDGSPHDPRLVLI
ncbi:MAG: pyridoxamine 5'-phosphate oxidase family protein, partial [Gammaproteobacteria bacterium]